MFFTNALIADYSRYVGIGFLPGKPIAHLQWNLFLRRSVMVWDWLGGNWKQFLGLIQENWGRLIHNDLVVAAGKREQLIGLLQQHCGYPRTQSEKAIDQYSIGFARMRKLRNAFLR